MNGNRRNDTGGVPPRWLKCPRKSMGFVGEKFLVYKTPLDNRYDDYVSNQYRFYPKMILDYIKMRKGKLGLWVDLTNTDRFYSRETIDKEGCGYVKITCRGHGEAPNPEQTKLFIKVCEQFMKQNPLDFIGVHCTHGFNRSGYLICAFLVEVWDWSIHAALSHFAKLRPPGIYKQQYIEQLHRLYGASDEPIIPTPQMPDWCYEDEEEEDDDGFATHLPGSSGSSAGSSRGGKRSFDDQESQNSNGRPAKRKKEFYKQNPAFMHGVPGVDPITDRQELSDLQRKVQDMCEWKSSGFPGSQPVSMDINNIRFLEEKPYMVSWKADGTRYLMLIDGVDRIYFIDRDNCVFKANGLTFPYKKDLNQHLEETLVDGEMVLDNVNNDVVPRYLIYDIIKFRGQEVGKMDFRIRLNCIRDEIINPRVKAIERGHINRSSEPFGVRFKPFWFLVDTEKIFTGLEKDLVHEPDGLIFQPTKDPYVCGRCDNVLKWKPPELNTVDFRLNIVTQSGEGLLPTRIGELYVGSLKTPFSKMKVTKAIGHLHGKIIECKFENNGWVFLRERTDKSFPNAYSTATAVCESIKQPVTKEYLLEFIHRRSYRRL